jgi:L-lactate utilization protein LutC
VVFAREITPGLTSLVKKLDDATKTNADAKMGSFVVIMTDDDKAEDALKKMAEKEKIKNVVLTIDSPKGPEKWKLSKDANVTVLLYVKNTVKENFAFAKDVDDKEADKIVEKLSAILPEKEKSDKKEDKKDK